MVQPSEAAQAPVRAGDLVAGKYRVERVLGAGGMGVVVCARDEQLERRVALKFLLTDSVRGSGAIQRFQREAKAAARIHSEHVARVLDFGSLENGTPYVAMEYLEGRDLADELASRGPLPLDEAVGYVLQAAEAFAEAHAAGIVHRDVKPSNLFLLKRGNAAPTIKVLDFGISKLHANPESGVQEAKLTSTRAIMGSPLYMSPEQITSSKNVDARADVWSLGVTLYELLTNRPPFLGDGMTEIIAQVLMTSVPSVRSLRADLPAEFESALAGALKKNRDERYPDMAAFATALAGFGPRWAPMMLDRVLQASGSDAVAASASAGAPAEKTSGQGPDAFARTAAATPRQGADALAQTAQAAAPAPLAVQVSSPPQVISTNAGGASRRPGRTGAVALGIGVLALVAGGVAFLSGRGSKADVAIEAPAASATATASAPARDPVAVPPVTAANATASASTTTPSVPPAPPPRAHGTVTPAPRRSASPLPSPSPSAAPSPPSDHVKATTDFGP